MKKEKTKFKDIYIEQAGNTYFLTRKGYFLEEIYIGKPSEKTIIKFAKKFSDYNNIKEG